LSIARQCQLLGLPRSTWYYKPAMESPEDLALMRQIDEVYLKWPFYGSRKIADELGVNRKRVQRLMRQMGLQAIYPKRRTTWPGAGHKIYPYLLRNVEIAQPDQVWSTDITYVPMRHGFLYLVAVMDWYSRHVLAWRLSNTLDAAFCLEAAESALREARPAIFNTDQGSQFTSDAWLSLLRDNGVAISMDGRGRALDNVFIERLWRSVKYEDIYLKDYASGADVIEGLTRWFDLYTHRRPHQGLGNRTPYEVYHG
jgi:putative transposase